MNTLAPHPNPEAQAWQPHELAEPQDPWGEMPDHSGDLSPLPHMSPVQEAAKFKDIADDLKDLAKPQDPWAETIAPHHENHETSYTPRHLRLVDNPSTPASVLTSRDEANLRATLALRQTLSAHEPELLQEAHRAIGETPTQLIPIQPEQSPVPQTAEAERPAHYKGRRRLLGRFARLFSR